MAGWGSGGEGVCQPPRRRLLSGWGPLASTTPSAKFVPLRPEPSSQRHLVGARTATRPRRDSLLAEVQSADGRVEVEESHRGADCKRWCRSGSCLRSPSERMTFLLAATTPLSNWLVADTRLAYVDRSKAHNELGVKVARISAADGEALVGYAGLGETVDGVQPSAWLARALRGATRGATVEQSLTVLHQASIEHLVPQIGRVFPISPFHGFVTSARVNGKPQLYATVHHASTAKGPYVHEARRLVHEIQGRFGQAGLEIALAGSGHKHLLRSSAPWKRLLAKVLRACDEGSIGLPTAMAHLAGINAWVAQNSPSVGRGCIVLCSTPRGGHGAHFIGDQMQPTCPCVPYMLNGTDMMPLIDIFQASLPSGLGPATVDREALEAEMARLPTEPDAAF